VTNVPSTASTTSGTNRAKIPASPRTRLLDVINIFGFSMDISQAHPATIAAACVPGSFDNIRPN